MWIVIGVLFALWVAMNFKKGRKDGTLLEKIHPVRRMMSYIMPNRAEALVFFDTFVDVDELLRYVEKARETFHCDITHCLVAAGGIGLDEVPKMNRFTVGRRLYQRNGRFITFSMKRRKGDKKSKLATVKSEIRDGETFRELCERINESIGEQRSTKKTYADKEFDLFGMVPRPVLNGAVKLFKWLDYHNLLPYDAFIRQDPLYTSIFVANLGSLKMGAGYHHLFEWGNCPLFMMAGQIEDRPVVVDGEVVVKKQLHIRWTYDERIDDGFNARFGIAAVKYALEHPFEKLGCVDDDQAAVSDETDGEISRPQAAAE